MLLNEWRACLTAVQYFTRIPVPVSVGYSVGQLNASVGYFPLVGGLVAAVCILVFVSALPWVGQAVAVWLAVIGGWWLTGGFHEDGLADFVDGMGGGYDATARLTIMQDSRVGSFGVLALVGVIGLKVTCLQNLPNLAACWAWWVAHVLSRCVPVVLMRCLPYARLEGGKLKPIAQEVTWARIGLALAWALPVLCLQPVLAVLVLPLGLLAVWLRHVWLRDLGGYTGDCLGASQQLSEGLVYLGVVVLWRGGWFDIPA